MKSTKSILLILYRFWKISLFQCSPFISATILNEHCERAAN